MGKLYTVGAVDQLVEYYNEHELNVTVLEEGTLGWGLTVCWGYGKATYVVTEVGLNEWQSAHKVRRYNKMPKKYAEMIKAKTGEDPLGIEQLQSYLGKLLLPPVGYKG